LITVEITTSRHWCEQRASSRRHSWANTRRQLATTRLHHSVRTPEVVSIRAASRQCTIQGNRKETAHKQSEHTTSTAATYGATPSKLFPCKLTITNAD
jgi:hypothetical protein